jgi:hypothetical protein
MKSTIKPTDINGLIGSAKFCHTVPQTIRENSHNAKTHNAKNIRVFMVQDLRISAYSYVAVATDADPFLDEESIKNAHRFNTGDTGMQGSGLFSSAIKMASTSGSFNLDLCELITYSNGFVVSSTVSYKDQNISIFELNSESRPELVHVIEKIIGDEFEFKDRRDDSDGKVKVLHLFRFGGGGNVKFPLGAQTLAACREFCSFEDLDVKFCFRRNQIASTKLSMHRIFNSTDPKDFVHNRISSGIDVGEFEHLYSLCTIGKKDLEFEYDFYLNGQQYKISVQADCLISLFPGLRFAKKVKDDESVSEDDNEAPERAYPLVTLRSDNNKRKVGSKGGHDIADSEHRILVCIDNKDEKEFLRPSGEPVFAVHDSCPARPSTYTTNTLGCKVKENVPYRDVMEFVEKCKCFEDKHNFSFDIEYKDLVQGKVENYCRLPFIKIFLNVKNSIVLNVTNPNEVTKSLLSNLTINGCWYTIPENGEQMRRLIVNCLESFKLDKVAGEESREFAAFKEVYKILFPNEFETGINGVPLTDIVGESLTSGRVKEKILVFVKSERNENG